ncbi:MAG: ABC transporter ATP-binding protein [Anaerolineae bacterium]
MSDEYEFEEEEFNTEFNGRTVWRILSQTFPHWPWVVGFLVCITVVAGMDSYFTFLSARIIDEGILAQDVPRLTQLSMTYGILTVLQAGAVFGFIYLAGVLGHRVRYDMRKKLFAKLQDLSLSYFDRTPVGWIMSRVTSDVDRMAELVTWGLLDVTWGLMNIGTALVFMAIINLQLALIVFAMVPILFVVALFFRRRIIRQFRQARKMNSKITGAFNENITGVRVIKALTREERNLEEFKGLSSQMYDASFKAAWLSALFLPSVQFVSSVTIGVIVLFSVGQVEIGGLTVGGLQAFVSYVTFMLWPIQEMARVFAEMQLAIASAERTFSLMDSVVEVKDKPDAHPVEAIKGEIVFDNVVFYYEEDKPVLRDFNLTVQSGETIALVGPTGAGKSTVINLLCRFYEPKKGRILIDGVDYTDMTLHSIHSRIGMVLQTPHLFSGTIRENIRYGRLDATDEQVEQAAAVAGATEFIMALDKGFDEQVGEGGVLLSVGQKQLLSLARAILADPAIFIMDEATSSVDTLTEALIQRGMDEIMRDRTSFVIAHRLSTIKRADRILVIDAGQIAEMGTHAELIRQQGHYYNLYTKQFRTERERTLLDTAGDFAAR